MKSSPLATSHYPRYSLNALKRLSEHLRKLHTEWQHLSRTPRRPINQDKYCGPKACPAIRLPAHHPSGPGRADATDLLKHATQTPRKATRTRQTHGQSIATWNKAALQHVDKAPTSLFVCYGSPNDVPDMPRFQNTDLLSDAPRSLTVGSNLRLVSGNETPRVIGEPVTPNPPTRLRSLLRAQGVTRALRYEEAIPGSDSHENRRNLRSVSKLMFGMRKRAGFCLVQIHWALLDRPVRRAFGPVLRRGPKARRRGSRRVAKEADRPLDAHHSNIPSIRL